LLTNTQKRARKAPLVCSGKKGGYEKEKGGRGLVEEEQSNFPEMGVSKRKKYLS